MKIAQLLKTLPSPVEYKELLSPLYLEQDGNKIALAVASMADHMTDEGWELMKALRSADYGLWGHNIFHHEYPHANDATVNINSTDVSRIIKLTNPAVCVVQDKREWEGKTAGPGFNPKEKFQHVEELARYNTIFKLTVLKDAQHTPAYHRESAEEIGCHAWIVYYHPQIVKHLAPYVRERHLIRTYHSIDPSRVPLYTPEGREGVLLSGAVSNAYPLRQRLISGLKDLHDVTYLKHPGYGRNGTKTPDYIKYLSKFKVAICTSSMYGYALRKIIEATAAGCIVVTDLPEDDVLPDIDDNLIRVDPSITVPQMNDLLKRLQVDYLPEEQAWYADKAKWYYDYRAQGARLANAIEEMRGSYS